MERASEALNFEKALELKNMLNDIDITLTKQKIDLNKNYDFDLFGFYQDKNYLSVTVFFIREGLLFGRQNDIFNSVDQLEEDLTHYIIQFYEKNHLLPKEILVPDCVNSELLSEYLERKVSVPKRGALKNLLNLACENATVSLTEKYENIEREETNRLQAEEELRELLSLPKLERIEAFDNSHLFGTFYVGGMVVFDHFLPNKNEYRKFKISTEVKDDLSAMKEVIYRRYFRVLMEEFVAPDLILVDGGELQITAAKEVIDELHLNIPIAGLKKNDQHKTSVLVNQDLKEIPLPKDSHLFLFLNRIQDEVHRYAISYHRNIKSKGALASLLDMAPGIGTVRKNALLRKFGSLKKMKEASLEELETVLNHDVAVKFFEYLKEL